MCHFATLDVVNTCANGISHNPNGWPMVRCDDGIVRFAMTPTSGGDYDDARHAVHAGEILDVLPDGFAKAADAEGYRLDIALKTLRERLMPLELECVLKQTEMLQNWSP